MDRTQWMKLCAHSMLHIARQGWQALSEHELSCDYALPRPQELAAALNRLRDE